MPYLRLAPLGKTRPQHRLRLLLVAIAVMVAVLPLATSPATADASEAVPPATLDDLEARHQAELAYVTGSQGTELAEALAVDAVAADALTAAHDADIAVFLDEHAVALAAIESEYIAALAAIEAGYAEAVADAEARMVERLAAKAAFDVELDALVDGAHEITDPKKREEAFKTAGKALLERMDDELSALEDAADEAIDGLEAEFKINEAALKADLTVLKNAQSTELNALKAEFEAAKKARELDNKTAVLVLKADLAALEDEAEAALEALEEIVGENSLAFTTEEAAYLNDIAEQKNASTAFPNEAKALEAQFVNQYKAHLEVVAAEYAAANADITAQLSALKVDLSNEIAAVESQLEIALTETSQRFYDEGVALLQSFWDLELARKIYDQIVDTEFERVEDVLSDIRRDRLRAIDDARRAAIKALDDSLKRNKDARKAQHDRDQDVRKARHRLELDRLDRRHRRELRLIQSEHYTLRERVLAFQNAGEEFESLDEFFDPLIEPGSLFNVADRIGADRTPLTGAGVQVALIDTGIVDVPGLRSSNVTIGPDFSFEDITEQLRARDTNGHGTHMAGIIVGSDPEYVAGDHERRSDRTLGIAPAAELVSIKVGAADGAVDVTQVIAAIDWVIQANASGEFDIRVINLSYGTDGDQDYRIDPLAYAVERAWGAGIVVVVAGGNDGLDAKQLKNPAIDPFVISVGAAAYVSDSEMVVAGYSQAGSSDRTVDIVAPGRRVISLRNPGSFSDVLIGTDSGNDSLVAGSGTSQAAAVVTGAAALLLEQRPTLTPDQVKKILIDSAVAARAEAGDSDEIAGAGFLRIDHALGEDTPYGHSQSHELSDGSGSIDKARGSVRVVVDGVPLTGEVDIFGNSWTGNSWTGNSWTGNSWTGNSWTGNSWTGNSWTGNSWTGNSWTGNSWTGNSWTDLAWSGNSWTGNSWTGNSWTGNSWTGNSWTSNSWN